MKLSKKYSILEFVSVVVIIAALALAFMFAHTVKLLHESERIGDTLHTAGKIDKSLIRKQQALIDELKEQCRTAQMDAGKVVQFAALEK